MSRPIKNIVDEIDIAVEGLKRRDLSLSFQVSAEHAIQAAIRQHWPQIKEALLRPSPFQDIKDFHVKFGLAYSGPPRELDVDLSDFRTKFMGEELAEYAGLTDKDKELLFSMLISRDPPPLVEKLDALVDLVYVDLGNAYLHGFDFDEAWRRVHTANMAKKKAEPDGSDSKRGSPHDVVKPIGWTAPDLSDLVRP